jgi:hypothetical protein
LTMARSLRSTKIKNINQKMILNQTTVLIWYTVIKQIGKFI